jgi:hypothetical protein
MDDGMPRGPSSTTGDAATPSSPTDGARWRGTKYRCVYKEEDDEGHSGISLSKELMAIAGEALKTEQLADRFRGRRSSPHRQHLHRRSMDDRIRRYLVHRLPSTWSTGGRRHAGHRRAPSL